MVKDEKNRSMGNLVLQIALGLLFIVSGIWNLQNGKGDEIAVAIRSIFDGDVENVLIIVAGIIELIAGVFLVLRLFVPIATTIDSVLMIIIMICWIAAIVLIDFAGKGGLFNNFRGDFLSYLRKLSIHLLILGAIIKM